MDTQTILYILLLLTAGGFIALYLKNPKQDTTGMDQSIQRLESALKELSSVLREENMQNRREAREGDKVLREEVNASIKNYGDSMDKRLFQINSMVERQLQSMQKDNSDKLEKMRMTVDEKLHATLERRLGESFKLVSDRLELVHKGLGEMQTLASGVGDLKKVLTNVKTRGTWGEVQLKSLLEQVLTIEQYEENIPTKAGSRDRVEFAIKLPSKDEKVPYIYIPVDAKFPVEDYQRLVQAQEKADLVEVEVASKALEVRIKGMAKDIADKYLDPPYTTDFGVLYVPTEGLYAEVTQKRGLTETLQRQYRVVVCGPNTISAFLNSLQMGFRTLAIEKRSSQVWEILGAVKNEFGKFGDLLEKTQKKLQEASNTIESAAKKSRTIERRLGTVHELPEGKATVTEELLTEAPQTLLPDME